MKTLVAIVNYPDRTGLNNGKTEQKFEHVRNVYYTKHGIDVTVLSFAAKENYEFDGIKVITLKEYASSAVEYDVLINHAANIRNHYLFLKRYQKRFKHIVFIYHGHEVLMTSAAYAPPYEFMKNSFKKAIIDVYDMLKLYIWRYYLPKIAYKSTYLFVSNWMREQFLHWTKIDKALLNSRNEIIYNGVGELFEKFSYNDKTNKKYDFVTIRGDFDNSKYGIDIVNKLAQMNQNSKFLIIGRGTIFNHIEKAPNIEWRETTLTHMQIIDTLNEARYALMPTRTDAQGLMMCEMAAFGIPVITSDIPICHEVFDGFDNAFLIPNNFDDNPLQPFIQKHSMCKKDNRFFASSTSEKEVQLIRSLMERE